MIRRHHRLRVHIAAQVTSLMIPPAHPTASLSVPALASGNQNDRGFYKGFFRSLLSPTGWHWHPQVLVDEMAAAISSTVCFVPQIEIRSISSRVIGVVQTRVTGGAGLTRPG